MTTVVKSLQNSAYSHANVIRSMSTKGSKSATVGALIRDRSDNLGITGMPWMLLLLVPCRLQRGLPVLEYTVDYSNEELINQCIRYYSTW